MSYIHIIRDFYSYPESATRTLRIYTPDVYDWDHQRRFPVLYMFDGQNIFDHPESALATTWRANVAADWMIGGGHVPPFLIVGIDHLPQRFEEYSPWPFPFKGLHGEGDRLMACLVEHIKPYIDRTYRTLAGPEHTAVMGASLGGLMALYLGRERPDVFGRIAGVSPTLMWSDYRAFAHWDRRLPTWTRIYLDAGTDESFWLDGMQLDYTSATRDFYHHLRRLGYEEWEVNLTLEPGANHHETDWQRRFPHMIGWLMR